MSLTITEAWIRDRVQLNHDNLEDVRSLSLPGTYQEKIGNLGSALFSFTRLKQLDLSRNGLQSLQGLHHLRVLEKLNLYYNNISSLQELSRLRHNTNLQELDLRLNPVTKNEPDYRLYLVHMLPNLRKLDDRSVRESERKSALLHFDSDQATAMTERSASPAREGSRPEPPRPRHVRGLGSRSALEDDDSDLLDLLARTDGDLSKPRPVTGSAAGNPSVDIQPPSAQGYQRTPPRTRLGSSGAGQLTDRHRNLPQTEPSNHLPDLERSQGQQRSKFTEVSEMDRGQVDSNLRFTDENDAYTAYSSKVNFTPNPKPGGRAESLSSYDLHPSSMAAENFDEPPPIQRVSQQKPASSSQGAIQSAFLDHLLNLVDRYWNGSKSLHSHSKFQAQAQALLDKTLGEAQATNQEHMDRLQLDVARYAQENVALRNRLGGSGAGAGAGGGAGGGARGQSEVQRALEKAQKDVGMLQQELREVTAENQELQAQLMEARRQAAETASLAPREPKDSSSSSDRLLQENERLKLQLKHFSQLQELATMLQESHKSLVTTNDHLLKELGETKLRHREEVKQLHWSYTQLKQTMDIMPPSHTPSHTPSTPSNGGMDRGEGGSSNSQVGYESYSPGKKVKGFSYSNGAI